MTIPADTDLDKYCALLRQPAAKTELAARSDLTVAAAGRYIDAVCNEARTGLRLLRWVGVSPSDRMLEVGAGGGLLSGFLKSRGYELVAIEPAEQGFERTSSLAAVIREATGVNAEIVTLAARDLDPRIHGFFDLIFSVNVIEHFQPLRENLDALAGLMSASGMQAHTCPNYRIPYEPHFGIALLPIAPHLTPYLGRRTLLSDTLWRSLNFITAADLISYAERCGLTIRFKDGAMGEALERLQAEPEFAARQPGALALVASFIRTFRSVALVKSLPATWVTPMTAILRRRTNVRQPQPAE
jgi:2-polyprenyl-3-methyl-5-hydroxy-6-metoxy-1,4-benzoquinol methylase